MHRVNFEHAAKHAFRIDKPASGICPGCKTYCQPEDFKETPYGDYLCRDCLKQDAIANPEIYNDPLSRYRVWDQLVDTLRASHNRIATVTDPQDYAHKHGILAQCVLCEKAASERNRNEAWVRMHHVKGVVCASCYERAERIEVGLYYLDRHNRCFIVTDELQAHYPFGYRTIPKLHVREGASQALWQVQHAQMHELSAANYETAARRIERFYNLRLSNTNVSYDDAYDVGINTLLVAASLFRPEFYSGVSFGVYLGASIERELKRLAFRKKYKQNYVAYLDDELLMSIPEATDSVAETAHKEQARAAFIEYCAECEKKVGVTNWYLFTSNLLENRTHEELGRRIGVIQQTVSARLKIVRRKCAEIAETNPQWKHLAQQSLLH